MKETEELKDLIVINDKNKVEVFTKSGTDKILSIFREKADEFILISDPTTDKGRKTIGSYQRKFGSSKKVYVDHLKDHLEDTKKILKDGRDLEKYAVAEFDKLRDMVKAPLDKYNAIQKERTDKLKAMIMDIESLCKIFNDDGSAMSIEDLKRNLPLLEAIEINEAFQEFQQKANEIKAIGLMTINGAIKKIDDDAAAAKEAVRVQYQRDIIGEIDNIVRNARKSPKHILEHMGGDLPLLIEKLDPEFKGEGMELAEAAEKEISSAMKLIVDAEKDELDRIKKEEADRVKKEADKKAVQDKIDSDKREQDLKDKAAAYKKKSDAKAKQDKIDADNRQKAAVEKAKKGEAARIEKENLRQKAIADKRASDRAHIGKINTATIDSLVENTSFLTAEQAEELVKLIYVGYIANLKIEY